MLGRHPASFTPGIRQKGIFHAPNVPLGEELAASVEEGHAAVAALVLASTDVCVVVVVAAAAAAGEIQVPRIERVNSNLLDFFQHASPLLLEDVADLGVVDLLTDLTLHERTAVVVLNISCPLVARHCHLFGEALFLEVADCEVVRVGEEVLDAHWLHVLLHGIHEHRSVATYLLGAYYSAEHNLGKSLCFERAEADAADDLVAFAQSQGAVTAVKNQANDIPTGHLWELDGEYIFEVD
eukprot:CAMPEP_0185257144 /NCGR_PEP_ID=MMETSP1359-20130426/6217_1 /TAXON_ID=552665 /ORGANISM="Bigelowiella longifila, Strain CCMP242" /LENGTH=238 /DNA_ID=CAMNT_0027842085 /DNA_START=468 /DNA_END=1186 /DNA_ORIENTATION=-